MRVCSGLSFIHVVLAAGWRPRLDTSWRHCDLRTAWLETGMRWGNKEVFEISEVMWLLASEMWGVGKKDWLRIFHTCSISDIPLSDFSYDQLEIVFEKLSFFLGCFHSSFASLANIRIRTFDPFCGDIGKYGFKMSFISHFSIGKYNSFPLYYSGKYSRSCRSRCRSYKIVLKPTDWGHCFHFNSKLVLVTLHSHAHVHTSLSYFLKMNVCLKHDSGKI